MSKGEVSVIGLGYVGLPLACKLASTGFMTNGVDIDGKKVEAINKGVLPFLNDEPRLQGMLEDGYSRGLLRASTKVSSIKGSEAIFVCVDTPIDARKKPILTYLKRAVKDVGKNMKRGALVSIESTLPPLTMTGMVIPELERASKMEAGKDFSVVHCPERVMPNRILNNLEQCDRVLGGLDARSIRLAKRYYSAIVRGKLHPADLTSAEIAKTAENTYRDVQIGFANEMGLLCERLGADFFEVRKLVNTCPGREMLYAGSGVGGHCLPKDSYLLLSPAKRFKSEVILAARKVNDGMPLHLAKMAERAMKENGIGMQEARIAVMGLAFLSDSDDTRNSPAIKVIDHFAGKAKKVVVHDAFVRKMYKAELVREPFEALSGADCAIFVTDHSEYSKLDLDEMKERMSTPIVVDGRNIFEARECKEHGIAYYGVGKGTPL